MRMKELRPMAVLGCLFVLAILMAMLTVSLLPTSYRVFGEDTESVVNPLLYIVFILAFTAVILYVAKKGLDQLVLWIILGATAISVGYVTYPYVLRALAPDPNTASGGAVLIAAVAGTAMGYVSVVVLYLYPEWYVVDITGAFLAIGVTAILGFSMGILPLVILLVLLAVYDAISVYRTKHMVALADTVMEQRLPILLVVPKQLDYSFLEQKPLRKQLEDKEEREAMFMGLGDIIIPGSLVVSAFVFLDPTVVALGLSGRLLVALITLLGSLLGFLFLMRAVLSGNPQAGLPLLNGGAVSAYFMGAFAIYGGVGFDLPTF